MNAQLASPPAPASDPRVDAPRVDRNVALLRAHLLAEVTESITFLEQRLARSLPFGGFGVKSATQDVQRRAAQQVEAILVHAQRLAHGEQPMPEPCAAYVKHDEAWDRADKKHGKYPELEAALRERFQARVRATAKLLHEGHGSTYEDLVRTAYATRDEAARALAHELEVAERVLHLAEKEPALVRVPPLVGVHVLRVLRETQVRSRDRLHERIDKAYAMPLHAC